MDHTFTDKHIYMQLRDFIHDNKPCVLATVIATEGSTPQKPGSSMIIDKNGICAGTVGGGVVELDIEKIGKEAVQNKTSGYYRYNLDHDITDVEEAICGGGMQIVLDARPEKHISVLEEYREAALLGISGVMITECTIETSGGCEINRVWLTKENLLDRTEGFSSEIIDDVQSMLSKRNPNESREISLPSTGEKEKVMFLESIVPLPQLIIAGAGHVGTALTHLGRLLDFEVIVWDDREEFANKNNLPDAHVILNGSMEESLGNINVGRDTFIVIVTRGHKNDADVLKMFLNSGAGYIGMIGSRKKVSQVRGSFVKKGWVTTEQWEKIYSPIGLDIHSKTVQEIAISIAAQLIKVRYELNNSNG